MRIIKSKFLTFTFIFVLILFTVISIYFSYKKYSNFEFGKFDLGNMNQMLHNSSRGNFMEITDYYGSNVSRFSMSHVDFSIILLIPFHYLFPDAFFLVVFQRLLFFSTALLFFLIGLKLKFSIIESSLVSLLIFFMPISGFNLVNTTFHPLIFSLFFVPLIYFFTIRSSKINNKAKFIILISFLITIFSKEELGLIMGFYSVFLLSKNRINSKFFIILSLFSFVWSLVAIFYIIPTYDYQRIKSIQNFLNEMQFEPSEITLNIKGENYFLYRYRDLGDSYQSILTNLILNPGLILEPILKRDSLNTLFELFSPTFGMMFVNPFLIFSILPEVFIHGLSGSREIFSIQNHRLTIVIPLIIISLFESLNKLRRKNSKIILPLVTVIFLYNLYFSVNIKSPLLYLTYDKIISIFNSRVFASESNVILKDNYLQPDCRDKILKVIPKNASFSGPQNFGAKTSNRRVNALFPSAINRVDYILIDTNEKKLANNLKISSEKLLVQAISLLNNKNYRVLVSCNNLTLVKKIKN